MTLQAGEDRRKDTDARLEAFLIHSLASGDDIPLTPAFWTELRRDAATILAGQMQPEKAPLKK
jgi:antitoxin ParD1/3/4